MEQIYTPKQDYKVLVRCFTYNQSKYIEDALNGFAMQKTDFPFVCLVMDDCSTDGEQKVIKAWMELECDMTKAEFVDHELSNVVLVPHKTNPTCTFAFYLLNRNLWKEGTLKRSLVQPWREHCEYEALCEGDDYWIDESKLEKQMSYLDQNNKCSLIITNGYCDNSRTKTRYEINPLGKCVSSKEIDIKEMLEEKNMLIPTASMCFRLSILQSMPQFFKQAPVGDKPLRTWMALNGNVYYMNDKTVVYRMFAGESFGNKVRQPEYAKRIYESMLVYYKSLDDYTSFKFHDIISYLMDKEEYMYYDRICSHKQILKCKYYVKLSCYMKVNHFIKALLGIK